MARKLKAFSTGSLKGATDAAQKLLQPLDETSPSLGSRKEDVPGIITFVDERKANVDNKKDVPSPHKTTGKYSGLNMSLQEWRTTYLHACRNERVDGEEILDMVPYFFQPNSTTKETFVATSNRNQIEPCQYTFLDLGANVGDSLGKFIDSGWDPCGKAPKYKYAPKYNLMTGIMDQFHDSDNVLVRFARHYTRKAGRNHNKLKHNQPPRYPEAFCYYGLEGNPIFTSRLKDLEERVMNTWPRPVRKAHFLTETVGAGVDGPTVLYLDTVSKDKNFWGSSLLTQPKYVQESAQRDNYGIPIEAPVQGMTLTSLVRRTTLREEGSVLLIKVDIEGGEFAVFGEVHKSGILCDYTARGATVIVLLEKHAPQLAAAGLDMKLWDKFVEDLTHCGVVIQGGGSAGR